MSELRVAFWNVENLFEPGTHSNRGPQSPAELLAKVNRITKVANSFFDGDGPDLLGVAEVGTERILHEIRDRLTGQFRSCWVPPGRRTETGLGLLWRSTAVSTLSLPVSQRGGLVAGRPRSLIAECTLVQNPEPFLVSVNHWKSRMQHGGVDSRRDRMETARWLGDRLARYDRSRAAIVLGDFNAEPSEPPFGEGILRGKRHFSSVQWSGATPAYLYNTAWRFMSEPDCWETASQTGYKEPRPKTTHDASPPVVFDHLLVSGAVLRGEPIELLEQSVTYHCDADTSKHSGRGVLQPLRWKYDPAGAGVGSSDHFPLLAKFAIL